MNYKLKTTKIENKPGQWSSTLCEIFDGEKKIGEYTRNYYSYAEATFFPFVHKRKEYALYSSSYMQIQLMSLPDCKPIPLKEECIKQMHGYCPVELFIPAYEDTATEKNIYRDQTTEDPDGYSTLGFALGCVWGDDSSWKLNLLDLSNVDEGEIWFIDNHLRKKWLYEEFPDGVKLSEIQCYFESDSEFPESYKQLTQVYQSFHHNLNKEIKNEESPKS